MSKVRNWVAVEGLRTMHWSILMLLLETRFFAENRDLLAVWVAIKWTWHHGDRNTCWRATWWDRNPERRGARFAPFIMTKCCGNQPVSCENYINPFQRNATQWANCLIPDSTVYRFPHSQKCHTHWLLQELYLNYLQTVSNPRLSTDGLR